MNLWLPADGRDSYIFLEGYLHTAMLKMDNQQGPIV